MYKKKAQPLIWGTGMVTHTWLSSIPTEVQEVGLQQGLGFCVTLLCKAEQDTPSLKLKSPQWWGLRHLTEEPPLCQRVQVTKENLVLKPQGVLTLPENENASLILLDLSHTCTHLLYVISYRNVNDVWASPSSWATNSAHYKGTTFSPHQILNEKTFQAVKNWIQWYLLWSFLSAALISNTRSRSHFCWTSLSIFFRKSTFAVPLRSCSAEKGRHVWLNRLRNNRPVTYHRPLLNSSAWASTVPEHCSSTCQQSSSDDWKLVPRSSFLKLDLRCVRKVLTTVFHSKGLCSSQHTHTLTISPIKNKLREIRTGEGRRGYKS